MQPHKMNMSKKQFRIGDLAEELKVKKFVIRFWEKEFGLKSDRSQGGQRFYTDEDLKTFIIIKELLYKKGFTIAGAKKQLYDILKGNATFEIQSSEQVSAAVQSEPIDQQEALANKCLEVATPASAIEYTGATEVLACMGDEAKDAESDGACCSDDIASSVPSVMLCVEDIEDVEEKVLAPAKIASCDCQDVLKQLQPLKQLLADLKMQLEQAKNI